MAMTRRLHYRRLLDKLKCYETAWTSIEGLYRCNTTPSRWHKALRSWLKIGVVSMTVSCTYIVDTERLKELDEAIS